MNIKSLISNVKTYWSHSPEGKYVSYKEIAAYSVGGVGVQFIAAMVGQVAMSSGCLLIGSVYGIKPMDLALLTIISTIITLLVIPLRGTLIDNNRSKKGKFRPFILYMGLPTVIITILMAFIPMNRGYMTKLVLVGIGYNIINVIYNQFYYVGYSSLVQVMTPNSDERTAIISISSIVNSLAPTITTFMLPLISDPLGGLTNIATYRVVMPIFSIVGLLMGFIAYFGTKERIVVSKRYVAKVKFFTGLSHIAKNKYFWITNISNWISFSRVAAGSVMTWLYIYQIQNNKIMSFVGLIIGTASLIGMLASPLIIKKFGKKRVVIGANIIFAISTLSMILFVENIVVLFILFYIQNVANSTTIITGPAVGADVLDYQQWRTGERLEGFSSNFGIIGSVLGMCTGLIVPYVTQCFGLLENYDILYDPAMRYPMFKMLFMFGAAGALAATIPYFFYDLNEKKHKQIILDLKERALQENKEDGIIETIEELDKELASN